MLYAWDFQDHAYWATAVFAVAMVKTWCQAIAACSGRLRRGRCWRESIAWWALLVAVVLTWMSGLDYARVTPRLWCGGAVA